MRSAPSAGFGDPAEGIAGAANKGFAQPTPLALAGSGARQKRPEHEPPGAARLAGDIGPYLSLLDFAYAQAAKIGARISSSNVRIAAVCEARHRQGSGTRPRGSPGLQTRALRSPRLWLWQARAPVKNARNTSRQARRGLRAISGQSHAKRRVVRCALFCRVRAALLFGTRVLVSKRCFAPARTGCRFGNARRFGRAGRFAGVRRFV